MTKVIDQLSLVERMIITEQVDQCAASNFLLFWATGYWWVINIQIAVTHHLIEGSKDSAHDLPSDTFRLRRSESKAYLIRRQIPTGLSTAVCANSRPSPIFFCVSTSGLNRTLCNSYIFTSQCDRKREHKHSSILDRWRRIPFHCIRILIRTFVYNRQSPSSQLEGSRRKGCFSKMQWREDNYLEWHAICQCFNIRKRRKKRLPA